MFPSLDIEFHSDQDSDIGLYIELEPYSPLVLDLSDPFLITTFAFRISSNLVDMLSVRRLSLATVVSEPKAPHPTPPISV